MKIQTRTPSPRPISAIEWIHVQPGRGGSRRLAHDNATPRRVARHKTWLSILLGVSSLATQAVAQDQPDVVWSRAAGPSAAVAFSPDGTLLAAQNAGVDLWRVADGSLLRSISGSFGGIGSLSFSPDSLLLAAGDGDGVVPVWRVWDGSPAWSQRAAGDVTSVLFAPDGTLAS